MSKSSGRNNGGSGSGHGDRPEEQDDKTARIRAVIAAADEHIPWLSSFSSVMQAIIAHERAENSEAAVEFLRKGRKLPDAMQVEVIDNEISRFLNTFPLAEDNGINMFMSLLGVCAKVSQCGYLIEVFENDVKAINQRLLDEP